MDQSGKNKTCIVTGSQGFLMGYLCRELLDKGYRVIGYDDYSKYGMVKRDFDSHPNFTLNIFDLSREKPDFKQYNPDYVVLGAALIGGIATFHKYAFDLVLQNELIMANCYKAILEVNDCKNPFARDDKLRRVITISSSMVYEGADVAECTWDPWPTTESYLKELPPPTSTYGSQKAFCETWARGAWEQYKIPYTIVRPFNGIGLGEESSIFDAEVMSGNVKLMMSHVAPDLVNKCLKGQDPLHIYGDGSQIRHYTHGKDIARGIKLAMESKKGFNNDFNISTPVSTTVLELAETIWNKINPSKPFRYVSDEPFEHDVQKRIPNVRKAKELLDFETQISLNDSIDELVNHMKKQI